MSWSYSDIEAGIAAAIGPAVTDSLIKTVHTGVSHLSDVELIEFLKTKANGNDSPAAVIFYGGGVPDDGYVGNIENAVVQVVIVFAGSSIAGAGGGVVQVLDQVRNALHRVVTAGVTIPLRWKRNDRFRLPEMPQTIAAFVMTFEAKINFKAV